MLRSILYFDVFQYPLTPIELYENSAAGEGFAMFEKELEELKERGYMIGEEGFVRSYDTPKVAIDRRLKGNEGARKVMPLAHAYSKKIASFPFVKGVYLSGALSKHYYDKHGDIDYFIVTAPNRVWICRTLLIMRYKLLPKDKKKYWCVNYFIAEDHLHIPDHNVFSATELAYLIPTVNHTLYKEVLQANAWHKSYFPNKPVPASEHTDNVPSPFVKRALEYVWKGRVGEWFDNMLLRATLKHWRKKYPGMNDEDFELQFRSRKHVCKRHTHGFQNKVLRQWEEKLKQFEQRFGIPLTE